MYQNIFSNMCRICLKTNYDLKAIFTKDSDFSRLITNLASVQVSPDDKLPQALCDDCIRDLKFSFEFKMKIEKSDDELRKRPIEMEVKEEPQGYMNEELVEINIKEESGDVCLFQNKQENKIDTTTPTEEHSKSEIVTALQDFLLSSSINTPPDKPDYYIPTEKPHKCELCDKSYLSRGSLKKHAKKHSGLETAVCSICQKQFQTKSYLKMHELIHFERERSFICEVCGKGFTSRQTLRIHLIRHGGGTQFICGHCSKIYYKKPELRNHILRTHLNLREFVCQFCAKSYKTKNGLDVHLRRHTGEKVIPTHECSKCDKKFTKGAYLKYHIRSVHLKERSYSCEVCNKTYFKAQELKIHIRTHTGERPYSCTFCDKTFNTNNIRKIHERIHTGERPHVCNLCGSSFAQLSAMKTHMRIHR